MQTTQLLHLRLAADWFISHLCGVAPTRLDTHVLGLGVALGWVARAWGWAVLSLHPWGWNGLLHGCLHASNTLFTDANKQNAIHRPLPMSRQQSTRYKQHSQADHVLFGGLWLICKTIAQQACLAGPFLDAWLLALVPGI